VTLTLTSDDLESHIIMNVSSTSNKYHYLVCGCIVFDCGRMDVGTDVRTYGQMYVCMDVQTSTKFH